MPRRWHAQHSCPRPLRAAPTYATRPPERPRAIGSFTISIAALDGDAVLGRCDGRNHARRQTRVTLPRRRERRPAPSRRGLAGSSSLAGVDSTLKSRTYDSATFTVRRRRPVDAAVSGASARLRDVGRAELDRSVRATSFVVDRGSRSLTGRTGATHEHFRDHGRSVSRRSSTPVLRAVAAVRLRSPPNFVSTDRRRQCFAVHPPATHVLRPRQRVRHGLAAARPERGPRSDRCGIAGDTPTRRVGATATRACIVSCASLEPPPVAGRSFRRVLDPKVFKAYDVRGIYPAELDEDGAHAIGRAFVEASSRSGSRSGTTCGSRRPRWPRP